MDELGLLLHHKKAPPGVRDALARTLLRWTRDRVRTLTRGRFQAADLEDVAQEFTVRCLAKHLQTWLPEQGVLSAYLFHRLRADVIDAQRRAVRRGARDLLLDDVELLSDSPDPLDLEDQREKEQRARALHHVVASLPRRRQMVLRRVLSGDTVKEVAAERRRKKVKASSWSTLARERRAAEAEVVAAFKAHALFI